MVRLFKVPVPCLANWQFSQMFETTPYLQQCVRLTIEAKTEFFFMLTEKISDKERVELVKPKTVRAGKIKV